MESETQLKKRDNCRLPRLWLILRRSSPVAHPMGVRQWVQRHTRGMKRRGIPSRATDRAKTHFGCSAGAYSPRPQAAHFASASASDSSQPTPSDFSTRRASGAWSSGTCTLIPPTAGESNQFVETKCSSTMTQSMSSDSSLSRARCASVGIENEATVTHLAGPSSPPPPPPPPPPQLRPPVPSPASEPPPPVFESSNSSRSPGCRCPGGAWPGRVSSGLGCDSRSFSPDLRETGMAWGFHARPTRRLVVATSTGDDSPLGRRLLARRGGRPKKKPAGGVPAGLGVLAANDGVSRCCSRIRSTS